MKKIAVIIIVLAVFINATSCIFAQEKVTLFGMRLKIFETSKQIRPMLNNPKDALLANSAWDTCMLVMSQLDAYFSMLGILNTVEKEHLNEVMINYLIKWLKDLKDSSETNIKTLEDISSAKTKETIELMAKLKDNLIELNKIIDIELENITIVVKSIKLKKG